MPVPQRPFFQEVRFWPILEKCDDLTSILPLLPYRRRNALKAMSPEPLDPIKSEAAARFLRSKLDAWGLTDEIRAHWKAGPSQWEDWWVTHHLVLGLRVRNALRQGGYGETELVVWNLDDYYVELVAL